MILSGKGVFWKDRRLLPELPKADLSQARRKTMAAKILSAHNTGTDPELLHLRFDSLASHDITYVGIIQTARASGMTKFPLPYVLTNCHNSLCAVGGTINEDDHQFARTAARKYGGIYVPPCLAVIHSYDREMMAGCGKMILGSDSHTRYGALGTLGFGEGGGELVKQLTGHTYDLPWPKVVLVMLSGAPRPGVGPQDIALALIAAAFPTGFVKNKIMEFAGPGIRRLSQDFRNGIDVMMTEAGSLSTIWETDDVTERYYSEHCRPQDYAPLELEDGAYYDSLIDLDLSSAECMIAMPMHPSLALPIRELKAYPERFLREAQERAVCQLGSAAPDLLSKIDPKGQIAVDQGIIAGCSGGTYENICAAAAILKGQDCGSGEFRLSIYPDSMPGYRALADNGALSALVESGAVIREPFCGPCFGAGDTPANGEFSIRHTTRNFPNREGSKPGAGQSAAVALMDARSIAATASRKGILTAADEIISADPPIPVFSFDSGIYAKRIYNGWGNPEPDLPLRFGPGIKDWPPLSELSEDLLIRLVSYIDDPITTTDELIPSGEASSYRSDPLRLAEFTLSRRDPDYVSKAKQVRIAEQQRLQGSLPAEIACVYQALGSLGPRDPKNTVIGSAIYANKPGDGSAREQAASCQRVLGGIANFAREYATKRYRTNCINWGILPFVITKPDLLAPGSYIYLKGIRQAIMSQTDPEAYAIDQDQKVHRIPVTLGDLDPEEREILMAGCLINHYRKTAGN